MEVLDESEKETLEAPARQSNPAPHVPPGHVPQSLAQPQFAELDPQKSEVPKPKRLARDVARLDANRLLADDGLPALARSCKKWSKKLKGKKHEFEDLQLLMLQYQKWGHQVFSKLIFTAFIESTEKICREKRVKGWRDALLAEERRRANGFYDDHVPADTTNTQMDIERTDTEAIRNQVPLDHALAEIRDLNRAEEEEMARLLRDSERIESAQKGSVMMADIDNDDDFDFDTQMVAQLGAASVMNHGKSPVDSAEPQPSSHAKLDEEFFREPQKDAEWEELVTKRPPAIEPESIHAKTHTFTPITNVVAPEEFEFDDDDDDIMFDTQLGAVLAITASTEVGEEQIAMASKSTTEI